MHRFAGILFALLVAVPAAGQNDATHVEPGASALALVFREHVAGLAETDEWNLELPATDTAEDAEALRRTVMTPAEFGDLPAGQRAGLLVALADRTALDGDRALARVMYQALETSGSEEVRPWGTYMLAGLDFADAAYREAGERYAQVCGSDADGSWRDHACAMADLAQRLEELEIEGTADGASDTATP